MTVPPTVTERLVAAVEATEVSSPLFCVPSSRSASRPEPEPSLPECQSVPTRLLLPL